MNYKNKYLKYKLKYLKAKKLYGGMEPGDLGPNETRPSSSAADPGELASFIKGLKISSSEQTMPMNETPEQTMSIDKQTMSIDEQTMSINEQTMSMDETPVTKKDTSIHRKGKRRREEGEEGEGGEEQENKRRDISRNDRLANALRRGPNGEPCDVSPEPSIDEN